VRTSKRIKRYLVYLAARVVAAIWLCLPWSWALALGRLVGSVAGRVAGKDRRRAESQMIEATGFTAQNAAKVIGELFVHLGMVVTEIVWMPRLMRRLEEYVHFPEEDVALLQEALDEGKGVIMISAHIGNWELLGQRIVHQGVDTVTIARSNPNPYLGAWLARRRGHAGLGVIERGDPGAARKILATLKRGAILGFLIDQDTRVQSVFVPFFGKVASTPVAPAQLALRRNIPLLAGFIRRTDTGHQISLSRVAYDDITEDDRDARAIALTARLTSIIEEKVRETPGQWVWFHQRWKRRPPGGPG